MWNDLAILVAIVKLDYHIISSTSHVHLQDEKYGTFLWCFIKDAVLRLIII